MIYKKSKHYKGESNDLTLYPSITDRNAWDGLEDQLKKTLIGQGDAHLGFDYPYLSATMYMRFFEDGNRHDYEETSRSKRNALNALVLAECVDDKGRYLKDIINGIYAICDEIAWYYPAHNSYARGIIDPMLPDYERPVLALFSCQTGGILAMVDYLLGDRLDAVSPMIRKRIRSELKRRIIDPYLSELFWWMGGVDGHANNWTVWCTQNILLTAFLVDWPADIREQVLLKASNSVDYFLDEYGVDGCCDEGANYYRKAGLCLFNCIEIMNHVTNGLFDSVYKDEKVYNIANYIVNVHVDDKYYINFADCAAVPGPCGVREFLFGKRTGNENLMAFAARDYLGDSPVFEEENELFALVQEVFAHNEIQAFGIREVVPTEDFFFESVGIWISKDDRYCLAVKAGNNDDSHNHNDTGSYTVYKDGQPLLVDVGVGEYTAKTFSDRRYEIWTMQSDYHNLPTVNGQMQLPGERYSAQNVITGNEGDMASIEMDISEAYPIEADLVSYVRHVELVKGSHITIMDRAEFGMNYQKNELVTNLMLNDKPQIEGRRLILGNTAVIELDGDISVIEVETLPIEDRRLEKSWDHDLYRVRVHWSGTELLTKIQ